MSVVEAAPAISGARWIRWGRWSWLIGAALYAGVLAWLGWDKLAAAAADIAWRWALVAAVLEIATLWLRALKWRWTLGANAGGVEAFFLSKAGGQITPARLGELAPLMWARHRTAHKGAWIVLDRFLEAGATLALGLAGAFWIFGADSPTFAIVLGVTTLVIVGVGGVLLADYSPIAGSLYARLARWRPGEIVVSGLEAARSFRGALPALSFWTVVCTALDLAVAWAVYLALGHAVGPFTLAVAQCAHALTTILPFAPNATGIPYAAAGGVLHELAGVPIAVLALAIPLRTIVTQAVFWSSFALAGASKRDDAFRDQSHLFDWLVRKGTLYEYPPAALEEFRKIAPTTGRVLDMGCGDGFIAASLQGPSIVGMEYSFACAKNARDRGVDVVVADARTGWPFREGAFDTVLCFDVLHHLSGDWYNVANETSRVLKDGGEACIVEPDARNPFVRWTQAPRSPIRVAPWPNEPAIRPYELVTAWETSGFSCAVEPIHIEGAQQERGVFPLWQRILKAPFVIVLGRWHRHRPNKFHLRARKET